MSWLAMLGMMGGGKGSKGGAPQLSGGAGESGGASGNFLASLVQPTVFRSPKGEEQEEESGTRMKKRPKPLNAEYFNWLDV